MIEFTKMHGLGNDFAVFNGVTQEINFDSSTIKTLAHRNLGIGADQIIVVKKARDNNYDFDYIIYNQDGSEVGQCGNAARCLGQFIAEEALSSKSSFHVKTKTTELNISLIDGGLIQVDMGVPKFNPAQIPLDVMEEKNTYHVAINEQSFDFTALSIGNPHAVIVVDDIVNAPVDEIGSILESHTLFPERVNVGFMQILNRQHVAIRVYERGAGETMACGSGACAAVVAGIKHNLIDSNVKASLSGGEVEISWQGENTPVMMTGPATTVYKGQITL